AREKSRGRQLACLGASPSLRRICLRRVMRPNWKAACVARRRLSEAPGRTASEEHFDHLLAADGADQLAQRAVDEEQHDEPELARPEVGPGGLPPPRAVCRPTA